MPKSQHHLTATVCALTKIINNGRKLVKIVCCCCYASATIRTKMKVRVIARPHVVK